MSQGFHCDAPACDTWAMSDMANSTGFLTIFEGVSPNITQFVAHFCSWDCVMRYAAMKEPLEKYNQ